MPSPKVKKFLKLRDSERKLKPKTSTERFYSNYNKEANLDKISGNLAYKIVFMPKNSKEEKVSVELVEKNGEVRYNYRYMNKHAPPVAFSEFVEKDIVKDLENYVHEHNGMKFYPVLDLNDGAIKKYISNSRPSKSRSINGKQEVLVKLPEESFKRLTKDIFLHKDAREVGEIIGKALASGDSREIKLSRYQKSILIKMANTLRETGGKPINSVGELAKGELDFILPHIDERFNNHQRAAFELFSLVRKQFMNVEDVDEATKRISDFFEANGIKVNSTHIRRWIELARKERLERKERRIEGMKSKNHK